MRQTIAAAWDYVFDHKSNSHRDAADMDTRYRTMTTPREIVRTGLGRRSDGEHM